MSPSLGSGRRATSKSSELKGVVKMPRPLADIAPNVSPWYAFSSAATSGRGVPSLAKACSDILIATSTAVDPLSEKNVRASPRGSRATSAAPSSAAGSCVKPANITWSSVRACAVIASTIAGWQWPWVVTHHDETASRIGRPFVSYSRAPAARAMGMGSAIPWCCVYGCQACD